MQAARSEALISAAEPGCSDAVVYFWTGGCWRVYRRIHRVLHRADTFLSGLSACFQVADHNSRTAGSARSRSTAIAGMVTFCGLGYRPSCFQAASKTEMPPRVLVESAARGVHSRSKSQDPSSFVESTRS